MKFLVQDTMIYSDMANALSDGGKNTILYVTTWQDGFPLFKNHCIGLDFENLVKRQKSGDPLLFWDNVEKADCLVNFDCHLQDAIAFLRKIYPEKSIWGSGKGQRIENDRVFLKKLIEALDLPVNPYVVIEGLTALKAHIKKHPGKYVKLNIFRGDCESFFAKDIDYNKADFLKLEMSLGPQAERTTFVVEDPIETDVEVGFDGFFNGEDYGEKCFVGVEYHKNLYVAKVMNHEDLPEPIFDTMEALAPVLEKVDYRGAISTEEKIVDSDKHYLLDICSRLPSPLSALYCTSHGIKNWAEFVYRTGLKQACPMDIDSKYVGAFALESKRAKEEYLPIALEKNARDDVRFQTCTVVDGKYYSVKGNEIVAVLVASGDSPEEVLDGIREAAELVDAPGVDKDSLNGIDKILEIIDNAKGKGIEI